MTDLFEKDRCDGCVFKIECLLIQPAPCTVQNVPFDKLFKIYSPETMRLIVNTLFRVIGKGKVKS